jgi:RimJ/RimL family protein N-acetyltransferase
VALELRTERLTLRPRTLSDTPAIIAGLNDWEVVRYLTVVPHPYTEADAEDWMSRSPAAALGQAHFVIDLHGTGLIGIVTIDNHLGYWLARPHHGRGYMTEACTALLDWHFRVLPDDTVESAFHVGNDASLNVQRKLGFVETGASEMKFVRSQQKDVLHIATALTRDRFETARRSLGRATWM